MDVVALGLAKADAAKKYAPKSTTTLGRRRERPRPFLARSVMATPPTIGAAAAASAITSGKTWSSRVVPNGGTNATAIPDPAAPFLYLGAAAPALYGTAFPDYNYIKFTNVSSPVNPSASYVVRFWFDGTNLELMLRQIAGYGWHILVDGQLTAAAATSSAASPGQAWVPVTFATRARRLIEVRTQLPWGGVVTGPNDTVWAPTATGPRVVVLGDSFTYGSNGSVIGSSGWVRSFADLMGWPDTAASGIGATGYLSPGTTVKFRDRLATDVISLAPDVVVICGGRNDTTSANSAYTTAALTAEVDATCAAIRAGLPNLTKLIVTGPFFDFGRLATFSPVQAAIFAGAAGYADQLIDTVTAPWFTGTGRVGATTGSGNGDLYISSDGVHPTQEGQEYLGFRMADAVAGGLAV